MQLGRYEVIRKLGEGGMARVMLGRSSTGEHVVLKVPFAQNADFAERVRDEARVGLRLNHPSVVDTLDLFEHEGRPILVVEYVEGASLQQLRKHAGPMPPGMVARVGRQVAEGLAFIHDAKDEHNEPLNMLHRDVAPGNILVTREGNAKLIDLGIARSLETKAKKTAIGTVRGTMRYLAPELLAGEKHSPATDLWALGVVLFEANLGRRAVDGDERETLAAIIDGRLTTLQPGEAIPSPLSDAVFALLAEKSARLQRARAAGAVLGRIEEAMPPELGWAKGAVQRVLDLESKKRAESSEAALAEADTQLGPPPEPPTEGSEPRPITMDQPAAPPPAHERTAATVPSVPLGGPASSSSGPSAKAAAADADDAEPEMGDDGPTDVETHAVTVSAEELAAPTRMMEQVAVPPDAFADGVAKPRVGLDSALDHDDGDAPTIRMEAADIPSEAVSDEQDLPPGAATEIMPAVDETGAPVSAVAAPGPGRTPIGAPDSTMKFPKPGTAKNPAASSSLSWQSVAAPGVLGSLQKEKSEPAAAAPAAATPAAATPAPATPDLSAPPTAEAAATMNMPAVHAPAAGPGPRMLQVDAPPAETDTQMPAADPRNLPPAVVTSERTSLEQEPVSQEPTVTAIADPAESTAASVPEPTNPRAPTSEPTQPGAGGDAASTPKVVLDPGGQASQVDADAATPLPRPAAHGELPIAPDADTSELDKEQASAPAPLNVNETMKVPAYTGDDDETERVKRWTPEAKQAQQKEVAVREAAAGFDDPLLSGELDWKPKRGKHVAIAAAVIGGGLVLVGVLYAAGVL